MTICVGGSGFIGKHICEKFDAVSFDIIDNPWDDAHDLERLTAAFKGHDTVIHLASNPDIAASANNPMLDFNEGTVLTQNVCEAARLAKVRTIIYASGSGVYGKPTTDPLSHRTYSFVEEDPFAPISPYGASKIAGEALINVYQAMYGIRGLSFRFANVVGPGQTHGVGYDFVRRLKEDPTRLTIMGDGTQTKSYIAVDDVIRAIKIIWEHPKKPSGAFNVATFDTMTVNEIGHLTCKIMNLNPTYWYVDGWAGDVPKITLDWDKVRSFGWQPIKSSANAMRWALESMV